MISNIIEGTLSSIDVNIVTDIFIVVILILLLLSIRWTKRNHSAPNNKNGIKIA